MALQIGATGEIARRATAQVRSTGEILQREMYRKQCAALPMRTMGKILQSTADSLPSTATREQMTAEFLR